MTLFSIEYSKSVLPVLTPYRNPETGIVNVNAWCTLSNLRSSSGLEPKYLHCTGVLSNKPYNIQCAAYYWRQRGRSSFAIRDTVHPLRVLSPLARELEIIDEIPQILMEYKQH